MRWRSPFGDLPDAWRGRQFRRACWPRRQRLAVIYPRIDELRPANLEQTELVWHIWHVDDAGDQSTFEGGLVQGWGGQMGAEGAEVVSVNGDDRRDGTMYTPTEGDRLADDWEPLDSRE